MRVLLFANLLAATVDIFVSLSLEENKTGEVTNQVYNVAVGDRITLNQLYEQLHLNLLSRFPHLQGMHPIYRDFRAGDVRHSLADISKARTFLEYQPTHRFGDGLKVAMDWYVQYCSNT